MSKNSCQQEIGNKLSFVRLSLYVSVWSQMNGRSRIYFVARLWTRSSFQIRAIDCGAQTCLAQPRWDLTKLRYAERLTVMLLTSVVFLRTYPRSLLNLAHCSLTYLFHVRLSVMLTPGSSRQQRQLQDESRPYERQISKYLLFHFSYSVKTKILSMICPRGLSENRKN